MEQIYVQEGSKRFPCTLEYMLARQGHKDDPFTLVVKDEEEADYWNGMRFVTGHQLKISTYLDSETELLDDLIYFTFGEEETVRRDTGWVYRKFKS